MLCNQDLNYCTNHRPCENGGTCFNTGEGSFTCKCPPGFTGTECQIQMSDCENRPCLNGGLCTDQPSQKSYTCECQKGWFGRHCEEKTVVCAEKPCSTVHARTRPPDSFAAVHLATAVIPATITSTNAIRILAKMAAHARSTLTITDAPARPDSPAFDAK